MRVTITQILNNLEDACEVEFLTNHGTGRGFWIGTVPEIGREYEVEVNIEEYLIWNVTLYPAEIQNFEVFLLDNYVVFRGKLDTVENDSCFLRLDNSLIAFRIVGQLIKLNSFIEARVQKVLLYDSNT